MKFKLVTKDHNNQLCLKGGKNKITIQAQSSRDVTPVEVKDNKDGSYSASFVHQHILKPVILKITELQFLATIDIIISIASWL